MKKSVKNNHIKSGVSIHSACMDIAKLYKFSIIIPVYNIAPYLRECLDSVLVQTYTSWEAICVDDGSTDGSGAILDEYAEKDTRIRVIHQANAGVSAARNKGLEIATGKWIGFLDGDDTFEASLLAMLSRKIGEAGNVDCISFSMVKDNASAVELSFLAEQRDEILDADEILGAKGGPIARVKWLALDKFYRRAKIVDIGLRFCKGMKVGEDVLFAQVYLANCKKILVVPSVCGYIYRTRNGSVMERKHTQIVHDPIMRFERLVQIWNRKMRPGLKRLLVQIVSETFSLGNEHIYEPQARIQGVSILIESKVFNSCMVPFLLKHGGLKARVFALVYIILPRLLRRRLLEVL